MSMEAMEYLKGGAIILGVLSPVASLIFFFGVVVQRISGMETLIRNLIKQQGECKESRESVEDKLHDRCTKLDQRISYLEGRQNGHGRQAGLGKGP